MTRATESCSLPWCRYNHDPTDTWGIDGHGSLFHAGDLGRFELQPDPDSVWSRDDQELCVGLERYDDHNVEPVGTEHRASIGSSMERPSLTADEIRAYADFLLVCAEQLDQLNKVAP